VSINFVDQANVLTTALCHTPPLVLVTWLEQLVWTL